jgi:TolA-binding protein
MSNNTPCPMHAAIFSSAKPYADATLAAHLATCPACERDWNEWETLRATARELCSIAPTVEEVEHLRGSVLFAARPRKRTVSFARVAIIAMVLIASGSVFAALGARYVFRKPVLPLEGKTDASTISTQKPRLKTHSSAPSAPVASPPVPSSTAPAPTSPTPRAPVAPARVPTSPLPVPPSITPPAPTVAEPAITVSPVKTAMIDPLRRKSRAARTLPREQAPVAAMPPTTPEPPRSTRHTGPGEEAFEQAWQRLKQGDDLNAAEGFKRASMLASGQGVATDADYWHAIALARHGRGPSTIAALSSFLSRWPTDPRAPEVSTMLGWLHVEDGACNLARPRFRPALRSTRKEVRESAEAGLGACDAK